MWNATNNFASETHCIDIKTTFTWKIRNYYASLLKNNGVQVSDFFEFENTRLCLKAQLVPSMDCLGNWLGICLVADSSLPDKDFTYSISLKNMYNESKQRKRCFVKRGVRPRRLSIISENDLVLTTDLLADDCLTIFCKVVRTVDKGIFRPAQGPVSCSPPDALSRDFRNLLVSKDKADVVFHVKGQTIAAHALILSSRSSVFAAMFRCHSGENLTRYIRIADVGISAISCLLQYIYTGEVQKLKELSSHTLAELYFAAEKYGLTELKGMCSQLMQSSLSKENVEKYAILAFTHDDQQLIRAVVVFFALNKNLIDTDLMRELAKKIPTLPMQILGFVAKELL